MAQITEGRPLTVTGDELKDLIIDSLRQLGFEIHDKCILPPSDLTKEKVRSLHAAATRHKIERSKARLARYEPRLLKRVAAGREVVPERIMPILVEVQPDSEDELLFRYATLHWSIPVSSGYGRRLRFLVVDSYTEKLMGVFGLGDPVFNLGPRDAWIGWSKEDREQRLHHVMDAFVLGAVPPYSFLLCGKLVAMLALSNEVREAFKRKYAGRESLIRRRPLAGELALITTTSALGRSSLYNRVRYHDRLLFKSVGFTRGSGEFHFSNGLYRVISDFVAQNCVPTGKHPRWGKGFRSRREVIKKCLAIVGLSTEWLYHHIQREVYVAPLALNAQRFLRGEESELIACDYPAEKLFAWFRERWLLPRSQRDQRYKTWEPEAWRLWIDGGLYA